MTHKHLGIKDRAQIQEGLLKHESFAQIARRLNVSTSTISREVKNNRKRSIPKGKNWNLCEHKRKCKKTNICGGCSIANCKSCGRVKCFEFCPNFKEMTCAIIEKSSICLWRLLQKV